MDMMPYLRGMKITLNVDEALLERVMKGLGVASKTHAIDLALREMDRKTTLRTLAAEGLGLTTEELEAVFDSDYDLMSARVAEGSGTYRKRPRK